MGIRGLIWNILPRGIVARQNGPTIAATSNYLGREVSVSSAWIPVAERVGQWLDDLKESILKAVPKKKTSYAKKRMRAAGKGLKNLKNITSCYSCGQPKLMHQLCPNCYKDFRGRLRGSNNQTNVEA